MKRILVFAGSNSSSSINQQLAQYTSTLLSDTKATVIELKDFPAPVFSEDLESKEGYPNSMKALNELFNDHDAFIVSLPEYNSSLTPVFKNTVDWISRIDYPPFKDKPVLLLSTSNGARGAITALKYVADIMPRWGGTVIETYSLPKFKEHFSIESGELINSGEVKKLKDLVKLFEKKINSI